MLGTITPANNITFDLVAIDVAVNLSGFATHTVTMCPPPTTAQCCSSPSPTGTSPS
jgi:hypothetical protein